MIFVVVILALAAAAFARTRRREASARPALGPLGWVAGTDWAVVRPLARVECRRLLLHPVFISGVIVTILIFMVGLTDEHGDWTWASTLVALALSPFGWFVILATDLLMNRPARTGADELFASLPAPQPVRTTGMLATMGAAVPVAAVIAVTELLFIAKTREDRLTGSPQLLESAAGLLLAAGAVAVGVSLGRYFRHPMFGLVGAIVVIVLQARFEEAASWPWNAEESNPIRFIGFLGSETSAPPGLEYRPAAWHLVYLVGLVLLMTFVALARNGLARPVISGLAVAVAVTLVAGAMQLRPAPASRVAAMVRFLEHPEEHQTCEQATLAEYCFDEATEHLVGMWQATTTAVRVLLPDEAKTQRFVVRYRVPSIIGNENCTRTRFTDSLIKRVADMIDPNVVWADDGAIHPTADVGNCGSDGANAFYLAVQLASDVLGLPANSVGNYVLCQADGQERAAYALWLGAAAADNGKAKLRELVHTHDEYITFEDWTDPPMWGTRFKVSDATKALALLDRPIGEVKVELASKWSQLQREATTELRCT